MIPNLTLRQGQWSVARGWGGAIWDSELTVVTSKGDHKESSGQKSSKEIHPEPTMRLVLGSDLGVRSGSGSDTDLHGWKGGNWRKSGGHLESTREDLGTKAVCTNDTKICDHIKMGVETGRDAVTIQPTKDGSPGVLL